MCGGAGFARSLLIMDLPHGELTGRIIAGFHETFDELGSGFSERVCTRALAIVLADQGLAVSLEVPLVVEFRGRTIGTFQADMVVESTVLVEVKASAMLDGYAQAQLLNYLKAAGGGVGLLLNFGRHPQHKRMVMGDPVNSLPLLRRDAGHSRTATEETRKRHC